MSCVCMCVPPSDVINVVVSSSPGAAAESKGGGTGTTPEAEDPARNAGKPESPPETEEPGRNAGNPESHPEGHPRARGPERSEQAAEPKGGQGGGIHGVRGTPSRFPANPRLFHRGWTSLVARQRLLLLLPPSSLARCKSRKGGYYSRYWVGVAAPFRMFPKAIDLGAHGGDSGGTRIICDTTCRAGA